MEKYRDLLPGQRQALKAIEQCRTPACGEILVECPNCGRIEWKCHSCGTRNCPKCQNHEAAVWLRRQRAKLLPVIYFIVTFTLPESLRSLAWNHQRKIYDILFKSSSKALRELAANPRHLGGEIGMTGVLHTHSRRLEHHPHVHYVVPGGCLDRKKSLWKHSNTDFLVPVKALSRLFRGKFLHLLKENGFYFPADLYKTDWVAHCKVKGTGEKTLEYLSRYLYRGVISEKNILRDQNGKITFSYREYKTGKRKTRTLPGTQFLRLLLRHVLPKGFRRVRDYGFLHGNAKKTLTRIQCVLNPKMSRFEKPERPCFICPKCGEPMVIRNCRVIPSDYIRRIRGSPGLTA